MEKLAPAREEGSVMEEKPSDWWGKFEGGGTGVREVSRGRPGYGSDAVQYASQSE
jgi:hypothetical protein